jgi:hypothetical protein
VAALRRHTPDVRFGSGCVRNEVKSCDHHEMVVTPYGIYPGGEHDSIGNDAIASQVGGKWNDLGKRMMCVPSKLAADHARMCRRNAATVVLFERLCARLLRDWPELIPHLFHRKPVEVIRQCSAMGYFQIKLHREKPSYRRLTSNDNCF